MTGIISSGEAFQRTRAVLSIRNQSNMNVIETIRTQMAESARIKQRMLEDDALVERIEDIAGIMVEAYRSGNKTMWAGNGGGAAGAQHMAGGVGEKVFFDPAGGSARR